MDISCIYYLFASLIMCVIVGIVLKRRGNWVAIVIALINTVGYLLKGLAFSNYISDED